MTHLLKPNDNGLASLDEVRAWMEAQSQETIDDKTESLVESSTPKKTGIGNSEWISDYCFFDSNDRTPEQWDALFQQNGLQPISLSQIYSLAKITLMTTSEQEAFNIMRTLIQKQRVMTGTKYTDTAIFNGIREREHHWFTTYDINQVFTEKKMDEIAARALFGTNDDFTTIRQTFGRLTNGNQYLAYNYTAPIRSDIHTDKEGKRTLATYLGKDVKSVMPALRTLTYASIGVRK